MTNPTIAESSGSLTIAAAPTAIALFIGWAPSGPTGKAVRISRFGEYEAAFDKLDDERSLIGYALRHFLRQWRDRCIRLAHHRRRWRRRHAK